MTGTDEVRVTNEKTGGAKGRKGAMLGAVDPRSLLEVAEVAGFGTEKYDRYNFLRGYDWSLSYDAMQRHANQFWSGQNNDDESGLPHMAHVAWHALALLSFVRMHPEFDDRPPRPGEKGVYPEDDPARITDRERQALNDEYVCADCRAKNPMKES